MVGKFQVSLKAIIVNKKGEILLLKNPNKRDFGHNNDIPGGRIDHKEFGLKEKDILSREIKEELGNNCKINITETPIGLANNCNCRGEYFDNSDKKENIYYISYLCHYLEGDINISKEHSSFFGRK